MIVVVNALMSVGIMICQVMILFQIRRAYQRSMQLYKSVEILAGLVNKTSNRSTMLANVIDAQSEMLRDLMARLETLETKDA